MNYVLYNESNWQCALSPINLRPTNRTTLKLLEHMPLYYTTLCYTNITILDIVYV
jgi:hypothetical protein